MDHRIPEVIIAVLKDASQEWVSSKDIADKSEIDPSLIRMRMKRIEPYCEIRKNISRGGIFEYRLKGVFLQEIQEKSSIKQELQC